MRQIEQILVFTTLFNLNMKSDGSQSSSIQDLVYVETQARREVFALQGGVARLPCPLLPSGRLYTVLWYKESQGEPFYTFDGREKHQMWSDLSPKGFGDRANIRIHQSSAELSIENIQLSESHVYRCRVDYKAEQTRNHFIELKVIVPPEDLSISIPGRVSDAVDGSQLTGLREFEDFSAVCTSFSGTPPPVLHWYIGDEKINSTSKEMKGRVYNSLSVSSLSRTWAGRNLSCQAKNNNISAPLVKFIHLDIYTYPTSVKITGPKRDLSSGRNYSIQCAGRGSNPPATLLWAIQDKPVESTEERSDSEESVSLLNLHADHRLDGLNLTCTAINPQLGSKPSIAYYHLSVFYPPIVELRLGANLHLDNIVQGTDVYFECITRAKPKEYKVEWYLGKERLEEDIDNGILLTPTTLVLQKIRREFGGRYTCRASNIEGDTNSNSLNLNLLYPPVCRSSDAGMASLTSTNQLRCDVDAKPVPHTYTWKLNTSSGITRLNVTKNVLNVSMLTRTGMLECFTENSVGSIHTPCTWNIVEMGTPDPPVGCRILNHTVSKLQIHCKPGWNGGLEQVFHLEVWDSSTNSILRNMSNPGIPSFKVSRLKPGQSLIMFLYSTNAKGRSKYVEMETRTSKVAELITDLDDQEVGISGDISLGIILGISSTLLIFVIIVAILYITRRTLRRSGSPINDTVELRLDNNMLRRSKETCLLETSPSPDRQDSLNLSSNTQAAKVTDSSAVTDVGMFSSTSGGQSSDIPGKRSTIRSISSGQPGPTDGLGQPGPAASAAPREVHAVLSVQRGLPKRRCAALSGERPATATTTEQRELLSGRRSGDNSCDATSPYTKLDLINSPSLCGGEVRNPNVKINPNFMLDM